MMQSELFPVTTNSPRPAAKRGDPICKRKFLCCEEWVVCGHPRSQHLKVGDCLEIYAQDGSVLRRLEIKKSECVAQDQPHTPMCGCPEFQAREFQNPFLETTVRRVKPSTMCGVCRHAKRDHHRAGCAACGCKKFVNPFAIKSREMQQTEMFREEP